MKQRTAALLFSVMVLLGGASAAQETTAKLLERANAGDPAAQVEAGAMYAVGRRGVKVDLKAAAMWFRKAAEQGNVDGQFKLGAMYEHGRGVDADATEAANWYRKAAQQGHTGAQLKLGDFYYDGKGV